MTHLSNISITTEDFIRSEQRERELACAACRCCLPSISKAFLPASLRISSRVTEMVRLLCMSLLEFVWSTEHVWHLWNCTYLDHRYILLPLRIHTTRLRNYSLVEMLLAQVELLRGKDWPRA